MKHYAAYIRVSTPKQGEQGSSLDEQRAAIESYAQRHNLKIVQWYEERETAAKGGRPVFQKLMASLRRGQVAGVVTHKIDRSARNLRDWADLGEFIDQGTEVHFAHESIDLSSRSGRLSADILAVVAADYVRNLRDEVRKGFYGRLKQGLYPLPAPVGYLDQGGGEPKTIDPHMGPLIKQGFSLYATGRWTLRALNGELYRRGLRNKRGKRVSLNGLSAILNNPFYVGLIRLKKTREVYAGIHEPLIAKETFEQVQDVLKGRYRQKVVTHRFRYQRILRCAVCRYSLIGERQKGRVYYRCHTKECPIISLREDRIDSFFTDALAPFQFSPAEWKAIETDVERMLAMKKRDVASALQSIRLSLAACDERLDRLTDALLEQTIDRETYLARKERMLLERQELVEKEKHVRSGRDQAASTVREILELVKSLNLCVETALNDELREVLGNATSNLSVTEKYIEIAWENPLQRLASAEAVPSGAPYRGRPRTKRIQQFCALLQEHRDNNGASELAS